MSTAIALLVIIACVIAVSFGVALFKVFKDKKVTTEEQETIRKTILDVVLQVVELTEVKTEEQLLNYSTTIIMSELKKNNITDVSETLVVSAIKLLLKINSNLAIKLATKGK